MAIYEKKNAHAKNAQKSGGGGYRLVPIKDKNPKVDPNKLVPIKDKNPKATKKPTYSGTNTVRTLSNTKKKLY